MLDANDVRGPKPAISLPIPSSLPFFLRQSHSPPESTIIGLLRRVSHGRYLLYAILYYFIEEKKREDKKDK
jgi:hypothetical protein